jgi:hypothetical protein
MLGGVTVGDLDDAREYAGSLGRPVQVGERLEEPPCVGPRELAAIAEHEGRPCPRVVLLAGNDLAANLTSLLLQPHPGLIDALFRASVEGMPAWEQKRIIHRAYAALENPRVVRLRFPPKKGKA